MVQLPGRFDNRRFQEVDSDNIDKLPVGQKWRSRIILRSLDDMKPSGVLMTDGTDYGGWGAIADPLNPLGFAKVMLYGYVKIGYTRITRISNRAADPADDSRFYKAEIDGLLEPNFDLTAGSYEDYFGLIYDF